MWSQRADTALSHGALTLQLQPHQIGFSGRFNLQFVKRTQVSTVEGTPAGMCSHQGVSPKRPCAAVSTEMGRHCQGWEQTQNATVTQAQRTSPCTAPGPCPPTQSCHPLQLPLHHAWTTCLIHCDPHHSQSPSLRALSPVLLY